MDLRRMREMHFEQHVSRALSKNRFLMHDQDILNWIFRDNWFRLKQNWNIPTELFPAVMKHYSQEDQQEFKRAFRDPWIIHFSGRKPTTCKFRGKFSGDFFAALAMTEYRDFKIPDRNLKNLIVKYAPAKILEAAVTVRDFVREMMKRTFCH